MTYMDLIPGDYSNAPADTDVAPVLLASEPNVKRGLKTAFHKEGDRTIKFTWEIGDGIDRVTRDKVTFSAELNVTHNKKGRGAAHYSATLWQMTTCVQRSGLTGMTIDGRNGLRVATSTAGAARFNATTLEAFAKYALTELRAKANDPKVLAYFKPESV